MAEALVPLDLAFDVDALALESATLYEDFAVLPPKHQRFVLAYLRSWNLTQSAREAGIAVTTAKELLEEDPHVRGVIAAFTETYAIGAREVLARLAAQARGDIGEFLSFDEEGKPHIDLEQAKARGLTFLIKKVQLTRDGAARIELYDAQTALKLLGDALGLFSQKVEFRMEDMRKLVDAIIAVLEVEIEDEETRKRVLRALGFLEEN